MSPHAVQVIVVVVMTILVALFTWTYQRDRYQAMRLWLIGWAAILVHFAVSLLNTFGLIPDRLSDWLAVVTLALAGTTFLLSVSGTSAARPSRTAFVPLIALPGVVYLTCLVFSEPWTWLYRALLLVGIAGACGALRPGKGKARGWSVFLTLQLALAGLWVVVEVSNHPDYGIDFALFELFAITGCMYWIYFGRSTPGVLFTSIAFILWGTVFPAGELLNAFAYKIPDTSFIWDLPKYFVAFGMILTLFETKSEIADQVARQYRNLFEGNLAGVYVSTPAGALLHANSAFLEMYGYDSEIEARELDRANPEREALLEKVRSEGKIVNYEYAQRRKDGKTLWVLERAMVVPGPSGESVVEGTAIDITGRKELEQQLHQSQKMEAVGLLAGGMAHDFNNLLMVINGYSQIIMERVPAGDKLSKYAQEIYRAGERAASLTQRLLTFSRRQMIAMQVLDLNAIVADMQMMLRRLIGEDVELVTVSEGQLGQVKADRGQIEQIIVNLVVNARAAMPSGGKLTIETANVDLDDAYARQHVAVKPGRYALLAVSDTGVGMPPEVQKRIFEPFFTTKEVGKGTGLGLSIVYGIVKQSGGDVWVYSEPGRGTTFKIYLPRVDERVPSNGHGHPGAVVRNGNETILLVEDESAVRLLVRETLEGRGYRVLEADSGTEAVNVAEKHKNLIHLMITDVVMPELGGRDLAARLTAARPSLKVLYMSGYTDDAVLRHGLIDRTMTYIQKPFTANMLEQKVRALLDA